MELAYYNKGDVFLIDMPEGESVDPWVEDAMTMARTFLHDGLVVGCCGVTVITPGVGYVWAVLSDTAKRMPKTSIRLIKQCIEIGRKALNLHRVQAEVRTDDPRYARFMKALGFNIEALLEKATSTKDNLYLMVRIY